MHFLPETRTAATTADLDTRLRRRFVDNPLMLGAGNPWFPDKCLGSPAAFWALAAVLAFADAAFRRYSASLPEGDFLIVTEGAGDRGYMRTLGQATDLDD